MDVLNAQGIKPGIKVDTGLQVDLPSACLTSICLLQNMSRIAFK